MALRINNHIIDEQQRQIGAQFLCQEQSKTNSRLCEMQQDLEDAMAEENREDRHSTAESGRAKDTHLHRVPRPLRNGRVLAKINSEHKSRARCSAEPNKPLKRWLAEVHQEQAWNNIGHVVKNIKDARSLNSTTHEERNLSDRAQDGSAGTSRQG
jgi:hypothetical protein